MDLIIPTSLGTFRQTSAAGYGLLVGLEEDIAEKATEEEAIAEDPEADVDSTKT